MLEPQAKTVLGRLRVDFDAEMWVITHSHQVPGQGSRLSVVSFIPCTAAQFPIPHTTLQELGGVHFQCPEAPTVVLAELGSVRILLLRVSHITELPDLASIEGNFHTSDLPTASRISISSHRVVRRLGELKDLIMIRRTNSGIYIQLVEQVLRLVPPTLLLGKLSVYMWGHDSVVEEVVEVVRRLILNRYVLQPLHHTSTNPPGDDNSHGETMVSRQPHSILLVRDDYLAEGIHCSGKVNGCAVSPVRQALILYSDEAHMSRFVHPDPSLQQKVPQTHACPQVSGYRTRTPTEANRLLRHVLLLTPVPGAYESHWQSHARQ
mmetsp:Transcript_23108/g.92433  ORF Transcript_23108/g.92433 Transcript_23108/m.92433 type:complete len:321 (-) Transcript_23108:758-1720(-)